MNCENELSEKEKRNVCVNEVLQRIEIVIIIKIFAYCFDINFDNRRVEYTLYLIIINIAIEQIICQIDLLRRIIDQVRNNVQRCFKESNDVLFEKFLYTSYVEKLIYIYMYMSRRANGGEKNEDDRNRSTREVKSV